jgi:hypothetical protein
MTAQEIYEKIQPFGYMTHEMAEIETFLNLSKKLPPNPTILETGTCMGKSACSWVYATGGHVWTMEYSSRASMAMNNIRSVGLQDNITILCCDSEIYPWNRKVDVVWLDSDHSYKHLRTEIDKYVVWCEHLICGHDYGHKDFPGVKQAVDDYFGKVEVEGVIWYKWLKS